MGNSLDMAIYAAILGMSDDELLTASFLPEADDEHDDRGHRYPRAPRLRTLIRASLIADHGTGKSGEPMEELTLVRNVSERGMCLVLRGTAPHAGDMVYVRLPTNQEFRGQVRWSDGRACGIQLFEKLDVEALVVTTQRRNAPLTRMFNGRHDEPLVAPPSMPAQPMRAC
ncbi:PilZ domain-containing protein [Novosphingobium sp. PhB165]|uniref:PilZ domain-containing protein n=1 Tax=Novosphingobium sp. PhB165 TaxID=2485105 RepID=UPI0010E8391F|nr:PilZ domain-containing protein [Novosphingobium sp. PhB165]TCM19035.1 PilZ domain-containing protein [Novosphingobium sp. PhB165]